MSLTLMEVEEQARLLSDEERARLSETLLETLQTISLGTETQWQREIAERVATHDRGETITYSANDVFSAAKQIIAK